MHVNYYKFDENAKEHKPFLKNLKALCKKYNVFPIPEVVQFGVEDATVGEYKMDNGMSLDWGCPWCAASNEEEFKKYVTLDREAWLDHVDPCRHWKEEKEQELKQLMSLSKDELLNMINIQKSEINQIRKQCDNCDNNNAQVGLSLKIMAMRMKLNQIEEIYSE
jgi:hypothetical protein